MAQKTITITIDIPEGYNDIKFNKDTNKIEFIKTNPRPKSWEEYCEQVKYRLCYTNSCDSINSYSRTTISEYNEFNTEEEAKGFTALGKLIQLHESWVKDWKPNWIDASYKYGIRGYSDKIIKNDSTRYHSLLAFPTEKLRDEFFDTFKDLIEEAKPFI